MGDAVDLQFVVKHLVDGTLEENLCRICLLPLVEVCENIFTTICTEQQEFCVADVLRILFKLQLSEGDKFSVCSSCFMMASTTYKFYLLAQRSTEILEFYVKELENNMNSVQITEDDVNNALCIPLPEFKPSVENSNFSVNCCITEVFIVKFDEDLEAKEEKPKPAIKQNLEPTQIIKKQSKKKKVQKDNEVLLVVDENGKKTFYKICNQKRKNQKMLSELITKRKKISKEILLPELSTKKGKTSNEILLPELSTKKEKTSNEILLPELSTKKEKTYAVILPELPTKRKRKKMRSSWSFMPCSKCDVKYRYFAKLKLHMKTEHKIDLHQCKICHVILESNSEFEEHISLHENIYKCNFCTSIFKKAKTLIAHLKGHEQHEYLSKSDQAHVCDQCGFICESEEQLNDHCEKKHAKKYTCHYCGKMYKGELSCQMHIEKHENTLKNKQRITKKVTPKTEDEKKDIDKEKKPGPICSTCGKSFVDGRSLMWHLRLHTNERPYACDICGRGFISLNRKNQHVLCAHTMPTKRCPLCPALFHMRSMVNTHIKKVHLYAHKRRNRKSKHENVHWRTETVPIQDLNIDIQNEILDRKTDADDTATMETLFKDDDVDSVYDENVVYDY